MALKINKSVTTNNGFVSNGTYVKITYVSYENVNIGVDAVPTFNIQVMYYKDVESRDLNLEPIIVPVLPTHINLTDIDWVNTPILEATYNSLTNVFKDILGVDTVIENV